MTESTLMSFNEDTELTEMAYQQIPYARFIDFRVGLNVNNEYLFKLPFDEQNVGNTIIASIHGGLIGGMLETASVILYCLSNPEGQMPKVIDFSLDYLRAGKLADIYVSCELVKQGKRIANVTAKAWQDDVQQPISIARTHLLLEPNP